MASVVEERMRVGEDRKGRGLRVALAGKLTAMTAPGGGEVQLQETARRLQGVGVDARLWRPWEESLADYDVVHLFGSAPEHGEVVQAAKGLGKRVALSPIAWFDRASVWREPGSAARRAWNVGKFWWRAAAPGTPSWRRNLYHAVDVLLPNSQAEAAQLTRYFQVPPEKISVVWNGADPRFAAPRREALPREAPAPGFALYVGRIEPRKNQLGFLKAMHGSGLDVAVVGKAPPGMEWYEAECRRAADEKTVFLGPAAHDGGMLESLYAACGVLALCSWFETPGLAAIEAAMSGTPLVLPTVGAAREYFGDRAAYVACDDWAGIRQATLAAARRPRSPETARWAAERYTWAKVAEQTKGAYEKHA